jgi:hypothetical protein
LIIYILFLKLLNAQKYSASGLLLYDDPKRAAPKNASNRVYPNGEFLPPEGTQRGLQKKFFLIKSFKYYLKII